MRNSPSLESPRFHIFASWSSKERRQNRMKLQGQPIKTISSEVTPSKCIASILMVVGHRRIGKRILEHLRKIEANELLSKGQISIIREVTCQAEVAVAGSYTSKPPYCMYYGSDSNHRTKDCPIFLESNRKLEQDSNQLPQHSLSIVVNHTMQ
jgi:hypothetical protein